MKLSPKRNANFTRKYSEKHFDKNSQFHVVRKLIWDCLQYGMQFSLGMKTHKMNAGAHILLIMTVKVCCEVIDRGTAHRRFSLFRILAVAHSSSSLCNKNDVVMHSCAK